MDVVSVRRLSASPAVDGAAWAAVHGLCCRTGDNGDPIAPERWELFARIWIEPYEKLLPEWTYVAENAATVVGYLTGCPDSQKFFRMRWRATLPLLMAIAGGRYRHVADTRGLVKRAVGLGKSAEGCFSRSLRQRIALAYPAHLHINIDAGYRRMGIGGRLIEDYFTGLRSHGVRGVHLLDRAPLRSAKLRLRNPGSALIGFDGEVLALDFLPIVQPDDAVPFLERCQRGIDRLGRAFALERA